MTERIQISPEKFGNLQDDFVEVKYELTVYRDEIYKMQKLLAEKEAEIQGMKKGI